MGVVLKYGIKIGTTFEVSKTSKVYEINAPGIGRSGYYSIHTGGFIFLR